MKRKHRPIGRYLLIVWILFLYIFAGFYVLHSENRSLIGDSAQKLIPNVYFKIPQDFHSRLKKHGLDKQFSVVEINDGKLYFYRDGKKCIF